MMCFQWVDASQSTSDFYLGLYDPKMFLFCARDREYFTMSICRHLIRVAAQRNPWLNCRAHGVS